MDPEECLVNGDHGQQVVEGEDGVVAAHGRVFALLQHSLRHPQGIQVVDDTLEEDQSYDAGEPLLLFTRDINTPGTEMIKCLVYK